MIESIDDALKEHDMHVKVSRLRPSPQFSTTPAAQPRSDAVQLVIDCGVAQLRPVGEKIRICRLVEEGRAGRSFIAVGGAAHETSSVNGLDCGVAVSSVDVKTEFDVANPIIMIVAAVRKARRDATVHAPPRGVGAFLMYSLSFKECAVANESIDLRVACIRGTIVKSRTIKQRLAPTIIAARGGIEMKENGPGVSVTRTRGRRIAELQRGAVGAVMLENGAISSDALDGSGCKRKPGHEVDGGHGVHDDGAKPDVPDGQPEQPAGVYVR